MVYLEDTDTDGDHKADIREVLFGGFTPAHPRMHIGCPRWGMDNRVYLSYGPGTVSSAKLPDKKVKLSRKDFRCSSANRRKVAQQYRAALNSQDAHEKGAKVFKKTYSRCHKKNGVGTLVGPDISDVRNRSAEVLPYDILDPNSKVEPRFSDYLILTADGRNSSIP